MQTTRLGKYTDWFNDYAADYLDKAEDSAAIVERKQRHTMRVLAHVRGILPETGASPELQHAMEIAALLHDVGRFPQIVGENTFDDTASFNHAEAGAAIIEKTDLLSDMDMEMRDVILAAIKCHNRATIPAVTPETQRVLEVLRDADKLDAIRNNLKYLSPDAPYGKALKSGLTWHDDNVSADVIQLAQRRDIIPFAQIAWSNDYILFLCCWIYELNYNYTYVHLIESGHFDQLLAKLPDNAELRPLKEQLREDLHWIAARSRPKS